MKLDTNCVRDVLLAIEELQRVFVNDDGDVEKEALWINDLYAALLDTAGKWSSIRCTILNRLGISTLRCSG